MWLQDTAFNCKAPSVFAFFECNIEAGGGDAASRRGEECVCNIKNLKKNAKMNVQKATEKGRVKACQIVGLRNLP
jgi:hypothetical protein